MCFPTTRYWHRKTKSQDVGQYQWSTPENLGGTDDQNGKKVMAGLCVVYFTSVRVFIKRVGKMLPSDREIKHVFSVCWLTPAQNIFTLVQGYSFAFKGWRLVIKGWRKGFPGEKVISKISSAPQIINGHPLLKGINGIKAGRPQKFLSTETGITYITVFYLT